MKNQKSRISRASLCALAAAGAMSGPPTASAAVAPPEAHYADAPIDVLLGGNQASACTNGFAFSNAYGRWMTTAGHCGSVGNSVTAYNGSSTTGPELGKLGARVFGLNGDVAAYSDQAAAPRLRMGGVTYWVRGAQAPALGEYVCFNGRKSGTQCGNVTMINKAELHTTMYMPDTIIGNQFCFESSTSTAVGGDSGAAIWAPENASFASGNVSIRGVLSSNSGHRVCGTQVQAILYMWGGTIVTEPKSK